MNAPGFGSLGEKVRTMDEMDWMDWMLLGKRPGYQVVVQMDEGEKTDTEIPEVRYDPRD